MNLLMAVVMGTMVVTFADGNQTVLMGQFSSVEQCTEKAEEYKATLLADESIVEVTYECE